MEANNLLKGIIFDIQGYSVHDGPGCRTVIFFKGCTMRCRWCSNPEGIENNLTLLYNKRKCILDKNCLYACTKNAITIQENDLIIDKRICINCDDKPCTDNCFSEALNIAGKIYTVAELYKRVQRDRNFWGKNGGITLSGGEPFMQPDFATALLKKCFDSYIHTAIETCGNVAWKNYENAIKYIDWIFYDLKHLNTVTHKRVTQVDNKLILSNAKNFVKYSNARIIFRMTLIPGLNNSTEHLKKTADFITSSGKTEINILPLHHLGREKYNLLNLSYTALKYKTPSKTQLLEAKEIFNKYGVTCYIGDETPF